MKSFGLLRKSPRPEARTGTSVGPLFNFLFLAALIVPAVMYIGGVITLMHRPRHVSEQLRRIKARVSIPVIASINGTTTEGD